MKVAELGEFKLIGFLAKMARRAQGKEIGGVKLVGGKGNPFNLIEVLWEHLI